MSPIMCWMSCFGSLYRSGLHTGSLLWRGNACKVPLRHICKSSVKLFACTGLVRVQCVEYDLWNSDKTTVFNDPIHGHIELPEICVKIINTPEFLRLRHIKQLGATYEVYPGASHNRFEHCIGVCHLAGVFGKHLKQQIDEELSKNAELKNEISDMTKEMEVTPKDIICLQIAGLCHDLGHGPMSHAFESHFIHKLDPFSKWKHEKGSLMMFDYLMDKNGIGIEDHDREFIRQLIKRDKESKKDTRRPVKKDFLYEVVSNDENGIDVDKWDYFARDSYHLGFRNNFDHNRLIKFSRVIEVDGGWHICYRDKQVEDIYHMYMSRVILHRRACQHKTVQILERMYMESLVKANEYHIIKTPDRPKVKWKISECIDDPEAFSQLTDHIFRDIRNSRNDKLSKAKNILKRIEKRKHYKLVSEALPKQDEKTCKKLCSKCCRSDEEKEIVESSKDDLKAKVEKDQKKVIKNSKSVQEEEMQILEEIVEMSNGKLKEEDLLVDISVFDYGKGERNPVDKVYFYNKPRQGHKYKAFHMYREDISHLLPAVYSERHIRLYIKNEDDKLLEEARKYFGSWCKKRDMGGKWKFQKPLEDE